MDKTHETKLETLLNGIHSNQIINASKKVLELKYIEQKIESAKQKLQKNEDSFIFEFSKKIIVLSPIYQKAGIQMRKKSLHLLKACILK